jgi:hypothetical protein
MDKEIQCAIIGSSEMKGWRKDAKEPSGKKKHFFS